MNPRAIVPSRVVFDTSTLVCAALRKGSVPRQALDQALGSCEICANAEALEELREVLSRARFDRYLSRVARERFVRELEGHIRLFARASRDVAAGMPLCRDPKDQKFLDLALTADARLIVASDDDLLVLHPWNDIAIVRPAAFLEGFGKLGDR